MIVVCGLKCIAAAAGTSKNTLKKWIREENFPAKKKDGVWRAVPIDVQEWFRGQINSTQ